MTSTVSSNSLSMPTSEADAARAVPVMTGQLSITHPLLEQSDEELARSARAGSRSAFEAMVRRFEPRLMAFLLGRCRTRDDAEDAFQQTFAVVWTSLHQYDPGRPLAPWLFTIAARIASKERSRNSRRKVREEIVAGRRAERNGDGSATDGEAASADNVWRLAARVLNRESYAALWLRYAEEMEPAQIAAVLGKRSGAVRVMLHRARRQLLDALTGEQVCNERKNEARRP